MMWGTKEVSPVLEWEQRAFPLRPPEVLWSWLGLRAVECGGGEAILRLGGLLARRVRVSVRSGR